MSELDVLAAKMNAEFEEAESFELFVEWNFKKSLTRSGHFQDTPYFTTYRLNIFHSAYCRLFVAACKIFID